jgi:single-stranded-DNA-specific exonuclease
MSVLWIYPKKDAALAQTFVDEWNIHPIVAQILIARGFTTLSAVHEFLYGQLPNLYDPDLFPDMEKATQRILKAILIYGDNDVDGMSGVALLSECLRDLGAQIYFHLPHRSSGKTSLVDNILDIALPHHCRLLITVDCGITAAQEIAQIIHHGIDVIITDHHEPISKIPHCIATLNPKCLDSTYPNRDLTGVGVAFKLAHALVNALWEEGSSLSPTIDLKNFLDLVALGTIADMGSLKGENRILVRYGLKQIQKMQRLGLIELAATSKISMTKLSPTHIASKIAPRLNSLGRIANPIQGVELLLERDPYKAKQLAHLLEHHNIERQRIEKRAIEEIEEELRQHPHLAQEKALVLQSSHWHPGIIAILSARFAKQYHRPVLILAIEEGIGKGSLRTIPEFPLLPILKENRDLLLNFGGHDFAAGLTIQESLIPAFKQRFLSAATKILTSQDLLPKLHLDAQISFPELTFDLLDSLSLLEPFGHENPPPLFYTEVLQIHPPKIVGGHHLKLFLENGARTLSAIVFGSAHKQKELLNRSHLHIAFTPQLHTAAHKTSIQLHVKDLLII